VRLPPATRTRLLGELDALKHLTRAEQEIRHTARQNGTVRRSDVRALIDELSRVSGEPTPAEREIILIVQANS
jgi:hypothetical protein